MNFKRQEKFILNKCSTIMKISAHSGASRQERQYTE